MSTIWLKCALWGTIFPPTLCQWCGRGRSLHYWINGLTVIQSSLLLHLPDVHYIWCPWPGYNSGGLREEEMDSGRTSTRQYSEHSDFFSNPMRTRVRSRYRPLSAGVHSSQTGWTRRWGDAWHQISAPRGGPLIGAGPRGFPPVELVSGTSWFWELGRGFHRVQTCFRCWELFA